MKKLTKHTTTRRLLLAACPALLALGPSACDDTLTEAAEPQAGLSEETLASKAGIEGSLIATYRDLDYNTAVGGGWGWTASQWVWGSVTSDDAYKGSEATDQPGVTDIELYNWSTGNTDGYLNDTWRGAYEGVVRANATLRALKLFQDTRPNEITTAEANTIRGEALVLRAHYHFQAYRIWGNIPYYREDDTDFRKANGTAAEAVTQILADLDAAIAALPTSARNVGRVSQWTAKAYKGRVLAYAGQWPAALTTLREVRQSGPYALETSFDRVWTGFQQYQNGKETILAFQASANDGNPDGANANWGERLNFPHSGSPYGCCGFHQPSQNLVNFFAVDANGLPLAVTNPAGWNARNTNTTAGVTAAAPVDPRLDWTVGRDSVPYKDAGMHLPTWIRSPTYGGPYSPKKHVHEKASGAESTVGWTPAQLNSVNIHIFRYADLLLLLAEAEVEAGSLENARIIVNEIRRRAGQTAQGCGVPTASFPGVGDVTAALVAKYPTCQGDTRIAVPVGDPSIRWAQYRVGEYPASAFSSQAAARTAVRYERRLELAMEGHRFFDLKRWGTFQQVLNDYLAVERTRRPHLTGAAPVTDRYRYYPIPSNQLELSKVDGTSRLTQNTGW